VLVFLFVVENQARDEVDRIRAAYRERDASKSARSAWGDRSYRLRMQELEWALLDELGRAQLEPAGLRVLEIGCGSGYFLSRFLDYGAEHAAGIDLMEERIAMAMGRDARLELVCGDAATLPWPDASFDLVTQFTCLSSVLDEGLRRRITAEMWRVTRPGGAILSYDMRPPPLPLHMIRRILSVRRHRRDAKPRTPTAPVELKGLRALFPAARIRSRSITLAPDLAPIAERSIRLAHALEDVPFLRTHLLVLALKGAPAT